MSVQSEITRLRNAKTQIATAISNKGVSVPNNTLISGMAELISEIPAGEDLDSVLAQQQTLINTLSSVLDEKAAGGGGGSVKTTTVSVINITDFTVHISATVYDNGVFTPVVKTMVYGGETEVTLHNVVVGSGFTASVVEYFNTLVVANLDTNEAIQIIEPVAPDNYAVTIPVADVTMGIEIY